MTIKNLYPTQRPALDLNFANSKRLDPRVSLTRASVGTYVGNDGLIKYAAAGEARFDHNPVTGESLGLLVEESRANTYLYSTDLSQSGYGNTTPSAPSYPSPDGLNTASLMVPSAGGSSTRNFGRTDCGVTNAIQTASIYAKAAGYTAIGFNSISNGYSNDLTVFDLSTGTVTRADANSVNAYMEDIGNGWYRCVVPSSVAYGVAGATLISWNCIDQASTEFSPYSADGVSGIYVWGAQLEEGSFPTSYIPTAGSTVTRAADVASLTNTNVYDTDSFTILNNPYGAAAGGSTLNIVGGGQTPVKRTTVYNQELSQSQINTLVKKDDEFWRWRILGSSFALPEFLTDGQVTVDWGDGTIETLTTSEHTFTDGGGYHDVGFRLDSGTYFRPHINGNASHDTKVVTTGPAPESMKLNAQRAFSGCSSLKVVDATIDTTITTNFIFAWQGCSSLTSFPLIDTSNGTSLYGTWLNCSSLTSFPLIDTSIATSFIQAWQGCSSLTSFPLIDTSSGTGFNLAWYSCNSLTSFPLIDTSSGTSFSSAWYNCSSLTSFPLINTSSGTNFSNAWRGCSSLTSFPLIDTSNVTDFTLAWEGCSSLTSFPLIDTSNGTTFIYAWQNCSSLTSFPALDTSSATTLVRAWFNCSSLTSFPLLNVSKVTGFGDNFQGAWFGCSSLTDFPAGFFDNWGSDPSWTGVANYCFNKTWNNCTSLTATSVENILNSIDTSGQSAPASGVDITIDYDAGTGTPSVSTAVTNLKSRGWTITLNGVAQ